MSLAPPSSLTQLRQALSALEAKEPPATHAMIPLGHAAFDEWLGGGLARGALHEIYNKCHLDGPASVGFGLGLALRAAEGRSIVWLRQDAAETESGGLYGKGLADFGIDPRRLLLVRARDPTGLLRAVEEATRCSALGAVLFEIHGAPHVLDLKASRRLTLAAARSGVTPVMLRMRASPQPSAATTRWQVAASRSAPLEANAPGAPALDVTLLRHRRGLAPRTWQLEWDRDTLAFTQSAACWQALSRPVVPVPAGRPVAARLLAQRHAA